METYKYSGVWKDVLLKLKNELSDREWDLWFSHDKIRFVNESDDSVTLEVDSRFYRDKLTKSYLNKIESYLAEFAGEQLSVVVTVNENRKPAQKEKKKNTDDSSSDEEPVLFGQEYTFDNFVVGDNNAFAANAAIAISKNPGTSYNPFLLYGGVGLGKTHLLQAVGNAVYKTNKKLNIIYATAETFTNDFVKAVLNKTTSALKTKYRGADVLLIDDIQFLQGKIETQEELFHTFNELYNYKKQMVFTSDRHVSELQKLSDRLKSRFSRGLTVDIQVPNYETRLAILYSKANNLNVKIPDQILQLISQSITSNVRDVEAALTTVVGYMELIKKDITIDDVKNILEQNIINSTQSRTVTIERIQQIVANYYNIPVIDLKSKKRSHSFVNPRQIAMYLSRDLTSFSTTDIGLEFGGRDHATVIHSCQRVEKKINSDPLTVEIIKKLSEQIKSAKSTNN